MKVAVIGTGTMGSGIAQLFAGAGHEVLFFARTKESFNRGVAAIDKQLVRAVEKGRMEEDARQATLKNLTHATDYKQLEECRLMIEAIPESFEAKKELFDSIKQYDLSNTILATNTSSLSITALANLANHPENVIGMHFFNPVGVMKLVEVIKGFATSQEVVDEITELSSSLGKTPVQVEEAPGFVVNRILIPMINEAVGIYAEGVASKEDIDTAMKLGANHPIGPLELADLVGLDVCLSIMDVLYHDFRDPKYRAHPLLAKMVQAGKLGRKTKAGFYQY